MNLQDGRQAHKINIDMRKTMTVTGVKEVISFDEETINLKSVCGEINIEGSELKIGTLDTEKGIVELEGKIDAVYYSNDNGDIKRGLFSKILR